MEVKDGTQSSRMERALTRLEELLGRLDLALSRPTSAEPSPPIEPPVDEETQKEIEGYIERRRAEIEEEWERKNREEESYVGT